MMSKPTANSSSESNSTSLHQTQGTSDRLENLFADQRHLPVQATWAIYQDMITAYREPDRGLGKYFLQHTMNKIATSVPTELAEVRKLAQTLKRRAKDILAYFDRPRTSNGPTEAINQRLEHLRGIALGFRNLTHYIARSLLETGGFKPKLHSQL